MKLRAFNLAPNETMIAAKAEYDALYQAAFEVWDAYYYHSSGKSRPEQERLVECAHTLTDALYRRSPYVLISICPYCDTPIWCKIGVFSLQDRYWHQEQCLRLYPGVHKESRCPHLFCVDGALHLNSLHPSEVGKGLTYIEKRPIFMAAEVPFVKPRVLNLPTMVAVMHRVTIAERYAGFPIVYFTQQQPPGNEFCMPWAQTEYVWTLDVKPGITVTGRRSDAQDYDLTPWIQQGKVPWVSEDETHIVRDRDAKFPYRNYQGRRHPYSIKDGQIYDLPDPHQGEAEMEHEGFLPHV